MNKEKCYELKERGIMALHQQAVLRYVGVSPDGMAIYAYGKDDKACLHSCFHPAGVERMPVPNHPRHLFIEAKEQRVRICDAEFTLTSLPITTSQVNNYDRCETPRIKRNQPTCWNCGEVGHIARNCPGIWEESEFDDEDDGEGDL